MKVSMSKTKFLTLPHQPASQLIAPPSFYLLRPKISSNLRLSLVLSLSLSISLPPQVPPPLHTHSKPLANSVVSTFKIQPEPNKSHYLYHYHAGLSYHHVSPGYLLLTDCPDSAFVPPTGQSVHGIQSDSFQMWLDHALSAENFAVLLFLVRV